MRIELPFPPSSLSGHAKGHWRSKSSPTAKFRNMARLMAISAGKLELPSHGDIGIHFRFEPPDNRSDRLNFSNRIKPVADGIADALGINDKRFLPSFEYLPPVKGGRLTVIVEPISKIGEFE